MRFRVEIYHDKKWQLASSPTADRPEDSVGSECDWDITGNIVRSWFAKGFKVRVIVEGQPNG